MEDIYPFAGVAPGMPLTVAFLSYGRHYLAGLDSDPGAIPDLHRLRRLLQEAMRRLAREAADAGPTRAARRGRASH